MKALILFFTIFFVTDFCISQDTIIQKLTHDNGLTKVICQKVNGMLEGECRTFYPTGQIKGVYNFKKGLKHGLHIDFKEEGFKSDESYYQNDILVSDKEFYENGLIEFEAYYKNGVTIAEKWYYENENVESEQTMPDEEGRSTYKSFYETGEIDEIYYLQNNKKNGECKSYYKTGTLKGKGLYENDKEIGTWLLYREDGTVERSKLYIKGKLQEIIYYNENKEKVLTFKVDKILKDTDIDILYSKVTRKPSTKIGQLTWMTKNLNVTNFRNGDKILHARNQEEWRKASENRQPAWCYPDFDNTKHEIYGKMYNWYAVNDPRGLAPKGWRISSFKDWEELYKDINYIFLSIRTNGVWELAGKGANSTGLSILPGNNISSHGFVSDYGYTYFWCIDEKSSSDAFATMTRPTYMMPGNMSGEKGSGFFVRCVKE